METEQTLKKETRKWLLRIEREIKKLEPSGQRGGEFLENIRAYMKDSGYFLEKGDLVRSFECVIWAWAICETARELDILRPVKPKGSKG